MNSLIALAQTVNLPMKVMTLVPCPSNAPPESLFSIAGRSEYKVNAPLIFFRKSNTS